ncbi:MAG: hypothetical protein ACLFVO_27940 [Chloroflexaceae bacterium]
MHPADSDHQLDPALAALHAILITLRDQACENATIRANLVALGQALCTLAEPPAEELSRTDDPQTVPTAAAGSTIPTANGPGSRSVPRHHHGPGSRPMNPCMPAPEPDSG